ncbi:phosphotransferase enzyme family protein [Zalerion maritima]|uniref:Phosphotransferase enzyme family protein n=1 Tax=Zalerion maritima TaxID=339359 RepID=A0AAD5WQ66_9PEZI|nr:phosphotransferase enzyme family protein [Zalerion maritima]
MFDHYSLPFFAEHLPSPLPSREIISSSQHILQDYPGCRIVQVSDHFVVKYGTGVRMVEGVNMLFVRQSTTIAVPTVYAIYSHQHEGNKLATNYIVMENTRGESLDSRWAALDTPAKQSIADQLRGYLTQLRHLPPPNYFGLLGKRPFDDSVLWAGDDADIPVMSGPFETEQQMLEAVMQKYEHSNHQIRKAEFYRHTLPSVLHDHPPVFTHGDFQRENIIVKDNGTLVMINWEAAGWYPTFWEYSMAMFYCRWDDDWHSWVPRVLDEYLNEYAWMNMIFQELWS